VEALEEDKAVLIAEEVGLTESASKARDSDFNSAFNEYF
jgi:hypothetical protein